jgi:hypothetical protein
VPDAGREVPATVTLTDVTPIPNRTVSVDVKLEPPGAAEDTGWFEATAVFMPADAAIPVKEIPAPRTFESSFVLDKENLLWGLSWFAHKERVAA